jgi:hypothetical protein
MKEETVKALKGCLAELLRLFLLALGWSLLTALAYALGHWYGGYEFAKIFAVVAFCIPMFLLMVISYAKDGVLKP